MRKGKATKLTGFQCPLELRKALDEETWITRTDLSGILIKLVYEHLKKSYGPEFMKELEKKRQTENYSNIRLPIAIKRGRLEKQFYQHRIHRT